jgi:hypothetical protein
MNMNILTPKTGAIQMGPKETNGSFLENGSNSFD